MNRENGKNIKVHITEEELNKRIAEIGAEITERFKGEEVFLVCILKGSVFFTTELAKRIDLPVEIDFMTVSSYGAHTVSSGVINVKQDLSASIEGKNVIIVEDIIDSGNTLSRLIKLAFIYSFFLTIHFYFAVFHIFKQKNRAVQLRHERYRYYIFASISAIISSSSSSSKMSYNKASSILNCSS